MDNRELYSEYEKLYIGKKKSLPSSFFSGGSEQAKKNTIIIFQYAFEKLLGWTPQDISFSVTEEIIDIMHLSPFLKYLQIPDEFSPRLEPKYFANILYPNIIRYDETDFTLSIYKKVLQKQLPGYPKKFFHDDIGLTRATICLSYVLREKLIFTDIEEVYQHFLTTEGRKHIRDFHLIVAFDLFETPIDYVHQALPDSQKNEFLFHFYKFKYLYKKQ